MTLCLSLATTTVFAETQSHTGGIGIGGSGEVTLFEQIVLLMVIGRGLGEVMQRIGQPAIIGQLLAGLILGPSLFGWVWPEAHRLIFPEGKEHKDLITGIANTGVLLLLLLTGMETDLKLAREVGKPAIAVAAAGVAMPLAFGVALGEFLPDSILPNPNNRLVAALFLGTALSISSIKIVAMVVREMNFMRRNLGQIIVSSAIMEDTVGWVIISITLGIAGAGSIAAGPLAKTVIGTALFLVLSYTAGRWLVFQLIRWVNDTFVSEYALITAILVVMFAMALTTQAIGVNTVLGAFVAGVLVGESPIMSQHIQEQLRGFITAFMMPIFFGLSGLSADLTILRDPKILALTAGLVAIASLGKFAGAFIGGRIGGLTGRQSLAVGSAMNARGSTEVIVATIGLSMGALTQNLYSMIVTMAVITTMAMPPMLRWALNRLPMEKEEEHRLKKEAMDEKGFISQLERLLIAADDSINGKFASRFAGFIAGHRGMALTVLALGSANSGSAGESGLKHLAQEGAKAGDRSSPEDQKRSMKTEISARVETGKAGEVVVAEGRKGYDLLFIGLKRMMSDDGAFSQSVNQIAVGFEGPLALVMAGYRKDAAVADQGFKILVPVNGTEPSRRAAEFAFAMAPPEGSDVTALHVASQQAKRKASSRSAAGNRDAGAEKAVLRDVISLGSRYGYKNIHKAVHTDVAPDKAILAEAKRIEADFIVIGTGRRVGDTLSFGQTTENVLRGWRGGIILVVS
ncbi:MAG: potassium transporter [Rhodospirillales bacterium]|nr:potassium transporter [Rhodospirillales bacterium]